MARPKKDGLEYFPLDVYAGIDDEVELIEAEYGLEGFAIFIKLLQTIYRNNYYINWTEKEKLIFSKRVNVTLTLVNDVITKCIDWGLFNKTIYEKYNVLTSRGIQRRYLLAIGRRMSAEIYKEYLLLSENDVIATKNLVIVTLTPVNVDNNPQSKGKVNRKEKEIESSSIEETPDATNISKLTRAIESTLGKLASPYEVDVLHSYMKDGMEFSLIEKALRETIENGARNVKYTKVILDRCLAENILTLDRYLLDQKSRKSRPTKEGEASGEHRGHKQEIVRSEAELIQFRRARELGGTSGEDEEIPF